VSYNLCNNILYAVTQIITIFSGKSEIKQSGTGFWVKDNQNNFYLVTNRHVIDKYHVKDIINPDDYPLTKIQFKIHGSTDLKNQQINETNCKYNSDSDNDIAVIKFTDFIPPINSFNIRFIPINFFANQADFCNSIFAGDSIFLVGFPRTWYDAHNNLPILRGGFISSSPQIAKYSDSLKRVKGDCLLIEATSFGGSSGSPVITREKGINVGNGLTGGNYFPPKLIGINTGCFYDIINEYCLLYRIKDNNIRFLINKTNDNKKLEKIIMLKNNEFTREALKYYIKEIELTLTNEEIELILDESIKTIKNLNTFHSGLSYIYKSTDILDVINSF